MGDAVGALGTGHQALVYQDVAACAASVISFVKDGLTRQEPVSIGVSVPVGARLRQALSRRWPGIAFFDMTELGRNPGRIIPAMLDFAHRHAGRPVRFVTEPIWPGRSTAEMVEAIRHEALVDLAFAEISATIWCLYDGGHLDQPAIASAEQTHPVIVAGGEPRPSSRYAGPGIVPTHWDLPLPPPPADVVALQYLNDLRPVRERVASRASEADLPPGRAADLVLAASEVAANTLRHTSGSGTLRVWYTRDEIICQIEDSGQLADPLAGRRRAPAASSGQGLWVVHQVCDLVELRTGQHDFTVRMHMRL
jgi:anti-sigma regulatory factor (Ser/Thr protein kinase)